MSFRFEMWTPPTALTFTSVIPDMLALTGRGTIELSAFAESSIEVPVEVQALPGFLVGVYDTSRWVDDFLIQRITRSVDSEGRPTKTLSGPQVNGLAAMIAVYPFDHPTSPSVNRDWIFEGATAANPHEIIRALLDDAQARGAGLWLDMGSSATFDALGTAWPGDVSLRAAPPQSLADVLSTLHRLGVNWEIVRKLDPDPPATHDLNLYGSSRDRTGGDVIINAPADGDVVDRMPEASVRLALGAGGLWVEADDTPVLATFGRWEKGYNQEQLLSTAALNDFLAAAETTDEHNRIALQATMRQDDQIVPLRDFRPGDLVPWQLPGLTAYVERPVQTITWEHADTCTYQVTGSKVYDPETALGEAVTVLLDQVDLRPRAQGWGILGYAQVTSNQVIASPGTETDLTSLTVTVNVAANRYIKLSAQGMFDAGNAGDRITGYYKESTTYLGRFGDDTISTGGNSVLFTGSIILTPSVGSHTYKLTFQRTAGSGASTMYANAAYPAYILVEDIGPA